MLLRLPPPLLNYFYLTFHLFSNAKFLSFPTNSSSIFSFCFFFYLPLLHHLLLHHLLLLTASIIDSADTLISGNLRLRRGGRGCFSMALPYCFIMDQDCLKLRPLTQTLRAGEPPRPPSPTLARNTTRGSDAALRQPASQTSPPLPPSLLLYISFLTFLLLSLLDYSFPASVFTSFLYSLLLFLLSRFFLFFLPPLLSFLLSFFFLYFLPLLFYFLPVLLPPLPSTFVPSFLLSPSLFFASSLYCIFLYFLPYSFSSFLPSFLPHFITSFFTSSFLLTSFLHILPFSLLPFLSFYFVCPLPLLLAGNYRGITHTETVS